MEETPAGDLLTVKVPAGATVEDLAGRREAVAAYLEVRDVRVLRDPENARLAEVAIMRRDPLAAWESIQWPHVDAARLSLWHPIPVGVDEAGQYVYVWLPERNVLTGGEPGSGKSVANSMLVATAALDPDVRLTLFDGKRVELACWAGCADRIIGPDITEAVDALEALRRELDERLLTLLANRRTGTRRAGAPPLGAHARLPGPLVHQEPSLLHDLHSPSPRRGRARQTAAARSLGPPRHRGRHRHLRRVALRRPGLPNRRRCLARRLGRRTRP
jgi:hypothetical protein